jgi:hypothetical protein
MLIRGGIKDTIVVRDTHYITLLGVGGGDGALRFRS